MNYYKNNIEELSKNEKNIDTIKRLESVDVSSLYSITLSKNNKISLSYNNKAITSLYSPDDEAKRLIDSTITEKQKSAKCLLGIFSAISSYNHIDYFLGLNKYNSAIIIENDLSLIKLILSNYYFESLSRVIIISENNFNILQNKLDENIKERNIINAVYVKHLRASVINKEYFDNIDLIYSTIAKEKILSLKTLYYFSPIWARNIISNFNKNSANSIESFIGILKNKTPILIVSAGSSIDSILDNIKKLSETHFVLALSHSLNTLIKNDIIPDAVITTDGGFYSYPHLFALRKNNNIKIFTTHTSYPTTLINIDNKNIYYFSHRESFETTLYKDTPYIPMCGSVIMPAISIAYLMNPLYIVLAGTDFCYIDNNTHSKYSFAREYDYLSSYKLETFESKNYRRLNIYDEVLCYDGEYRKRSLSLKGYFRHFESLLKMINKDFYVLTKESAKIDKVKIFDLKIIEKLENKKTDYTNITEQINKKEFIKEINNFFTELERDNTSTLTSDIAYIIAPWYVDNSSSFRDFKKEILSFKKLLFNV